MVVSGFSHSLSSFVFIFLSNNELCLYAQLIYTCTVHVILCIILVHVYVQCDIAIMPPVHVHTVFAYSLIQ